MQDSVHEKKLWTSSEEVLLGEYAEAAMEMKDRGEQEDFIIGEWKMHICKIRRRVMRALGWQWNTEELFADKMDKMWHG